MMPTDTQITRTAIQSTSVANPRPTILGERAQATGRYVRGDTGQGDQAPTMNAQNGTGETWPALDFDAWTDTRETLHMWTQVVGKVKLALAPRLNDWWGVAFEVTARGLTTSSIPYGHRTFEVEFDFVDHCLKIRVSDGSSRTMGLAPRSVAAFYREFMAALRALGIEVTINTTPAEVEHPIPFEEDFKHASYDADFASRHWRILVQVKRLMELYRVSFAGKSSPVLFWWGSLDLAQARYSGRRAPAKEWPSRWMEFAMRHEYINVGFWAGGDALPEPAFYAYTHPEPSGCREAAVKPSAAYFHHGLGEFILPYRDVRAAEDPDQAILDFFRTTYEVGARLAGWDRESLEARLSSALP
jgi:hypothetical protein